MCALMTDITPVTYTFLFALPFFSFVERHSSLLFMFYFTVLNLDDFNTGCTSSQGHLALRRRWRRQLRNTAKLYVLCVELSQTKTKLMSRWVNIVNLFYTHQEFAWTFAHVCTWCYTLSKVYVTRKKTCTENNFIDELCLIHRFIERHYGWIFGSKQPIAYLASKAYHVSAPNEV